MLLPEHTTIREYTTNSNRSFIFLAWSRGSGPGEGQEAKLQLEVGVDGVSSEKQKKVGGWVGVSEGDNKSKNKIIPAPIDNF